MEKENINEEKVVVNKSEKSSKKLSLVVIIAVAIIIILGVFYGGIATGKKYYPTIDLIKNVENKELGQPADVDFSLFWDAWRIIQSDYLKSDSLDRQKMVYDSIKGLMSSLEDQHSVFLPPDEAKIFKEDAGGSFSGVGMEIGLRDNLLTVVSPLEDTPAWRVGLQTGDIIMEIDGEDSSTMFPDMAVKKIRGERGTEVKLKIMRDSFDAPKEFTIIRDTITVITVKTSYLENNIAHLKLSTFGEKAPFDFYSAAVNILDKKSPGLILDLRNNPGGYLDVSVDIAGWLMKKNDIVTIEREKNGKDEVLKASGNEALLDLPIVVLVNEGSASASEILAGALKDNRNVKLIGQKTFGKGSVQTIRQLADNSLIKITVAEWLTPKGTSIDKNGIEPDYEVEMPKNWKKGDIDPQLQKALEVLKKEIEK